MIPPPVVLGLIPCEKVIVEEGTRHVTLVNSFRKLTSDQFPFSVPFYLAVVLTDGAGSGTIDIVIAEIESDEVVYSSRRSIEFQSRVTEVQFVLTIRDCTFPGPGRYLIQLLIDGEMLAHRTIRVQN